VIEDQNGTIHHLEEVVKVSEKSFTSKMDDFKKQ
jgi:hypothetical protein